MDQYRTWLSGLKRALLYRDDQTLNSTINIAPTILSGIPEGVRGSTFFGHPGLLKSLFNLQRALGSGQNADELKTTLSHHILLWEQTKSIPVPAVSLTSSPLPPANDCEPSNFAAEMKKYNADWHNPRMGQEDGHLTQTFTNQQLLATKYQGLDMLVDLLQECDDKWSRKLAQDASWGVAIDGKLQTILDLLGRSPQIGHSQTVADDKRGSYFGPDTGRLAFSSRGAS